MTTTIVGFGYRSKSGKDTAVAEIVSKRISRLPYNDFAGLVKRYAFADVLKEEVNEVLQTFFKGDWPKMFEILRKDGVPASWYVGGGMAFYADSKIPAWVVYHADAPMDDPLCPYGKQRTLLQWWGTEFRRAKDENYWVRKLLKKILDDNYQYALITDMRFMNEAEICDLKVRVDLPGLPVMDHISEHALDDYAGWDYILANESTKEQFLEAALTLFDDIVKEQYATESRRAA